MALTSLNVSRHWQDILKLDTDVLLAAMWVVFEKAGYKYWLGVRVGILREQTTPI